MTANESDAKRSAQAWREGEVRAWLQANYPDSVERRLRLWRAGQPVGDFGAADDGDDDDALDEEEGDRTMGRWISAILRDGKLWYCKPEDYIMGCRDEPCQGHSYCGFAGCDEPAVKVVYDIPVCDRHAH